MHNYHSADNSFPEGAAMRRTSAGYTYAPRRAGTPPHQREYHQLVELDAQALMLGYMEQTAIFNSANFHGRRNGRQRKLSPRTPPVT